MSCCQPRQTYVSLNHGRDDRVVVAHSDVALHALVQARDLFDPPPELQLAVGADTVGLVFRGQLVDAHGRRDRVADERVHRLVAQGLEHLVDIFLARAQMAREEGVERGEDGSGLGVERRGWRLGVRLRRGGGRAKGRGRDGRWAQDGSGEGSDRSGSQAQRARSTDDAHDGTRKW